jgi:hypothetical protein
VIKETSGRCAKVVVGKVTQQEAIQRATVTEILVEVPPEHVDRIRLTLRISAPRTLKLI